MEDKCAELWLPVVGYEGLYEVSNHGRVRSLIKNSRIYDKTDQIMRLKYDAKGYLRVNLYKNKKLKSWLVSRLVAMAFIPNALGLSQVGHQDDNKTNNYVENLYWTNSYENNRHNGKLERFHCEHNQKIRMIAQKLSVPVTAISLKSGEKMFFDSTQEAAKSGFDSGKISMCINGKRKSHKGYRWERRTNE